MHGPCFIGLLGGLRIEMSGASVSRFRSQKTGALLAYLACHNKRTHPREELCDLFWPDDDLEAGRRSLRVALSSLRRQLEPPPTPPNSVLVADRLNVRLNPAAAVTDVARFETALRDADQAKKRGDAAGQAELLGRAIALYAGPFLPGYYDDWVIEAREHLEALHQAARIEIAASAAAGGKTSPALPAAPDAPRRDDALPLLLSRFFGRESEVARLRDLLDRPNLRCLTLTGSGGIGKTRLALETARTLAARNGRAAWFVPLTDLSDARRVLVAVRDALDLPRSNGGDEDPLPQITTRLSGEPAPLLVLDNFEQIAGPEGARQVTALLNALPRLSCLVTSRRRVGVAGERLFAVGPLPLPAEDDRSNDDAFLARLAALPSVQLFVDRAQAVSPDFGLTRRNAGALADLVNRLDGLPLALELAAAWSQVLSPAQMRERLDDRFALLAARPQRRGGRGALDKTDRHRSLHATIAWSFDLLPPDLRRRFARLSVFRGGWTGEAAAAVTGEPGSVHDDLARLRERSLLLTDDAHDGRLRFRMLESLRAFADEQLSDEEREAARRAHVTHFCGLADAAAARMRGPEQAAWLARLEADHDNLRAALDNLLARSAAHDDDDEAAKTSLRLAGALRRFWEVKGHLSEGRERLLAALAAPGAGMPSPERASVLNGAANIARLQGDFAASQTLLEEDLAISQTLNDRPRAGATLNTLGLLARERGETDQARALLLESLAILRGTDNCEGVAITLNSLGLLATDQGDLAAARQWLEESLQLRRAQGDVIGTSVALMNLGNVAYYAKDFTSARDAYAASLAAKRDLGDKQGAAFALINLGSVAREQNDRAAACAAFAEALPLCRALGDKLGTVILLDGFAHLASDEEAGRERAARLFGAAHALRAAIGACLPIIEQAGYDRALADLRARLGEPAFTSAWNAGRALSWDQAIAYALNAVSPIPALA